MVSSSHTLTENCTSSTDGLDMIDIFIKELKNCLDSLQADDEFGERFDMQDAASTVGDGASEDTVSYKWLADLHPLHRPSKYMLDDITISEITDICRKIDEKEIETMLKEMQYQVTLCNSPNQLLSQVKHMLSESLVQHVSAANSGRSTPNGSPRRPSVSGMLNALKAFKRNRATAHASVAASTTAHVQNFDIEARQSTV